jgi:hypothetical protein
VTLATDASGAVTSTSKQVVDAINASASALVTATTFRNTGGTGVVAPTASTRLTDYLKAPATYPRGPQTVKMLRIGKVRDGSKVGVFIYCQEHAREWGTPLVCLGDRRAAAAQLRHRSRDDGPGRQPRHLHHPDDQRRRRRVLDVRLHVAAQEHGQLLRRVPGRGERPAARNSWGVDLNRNFSVGSLFDGFTVQQQLHQRRVLRPVRVLGA